jgi:DNA-binding SARP family transcriptional activator/Tfp pilus assembly protein PilF
MTCSLQLLGASALSGPDGPLTGPPVQRHRLALLALLVLSPRRSGSRDRLLARLWPERDTEHARRLLNQAVHALRRALGADTIRSVADELQLDTTRLDCDVVRFEEAVASGDHAAAVRLYGGPLLDGFFLEESPDFEQWVQRERDRLSGLFGAALESLAQHAESQGQWAAAVEWWKQRATHDPFDSRVALQLMQALERAGNRGGALQHALAHEQELRRDLGIEPTPELRAYVQQLRRETTPGLPAPVPGARAPSMHAATSSAAASAPSSETQGPSSAPPAPSSAVQAASAIAASLSASPSAPPGPASPADVPPTLANGTVSARSVRDHGVSRWRWSAALSVTMLALAALWHDTVAPDGAPNAPDGFAATARAPVPLAATPATLPRRTTSIAAYELVVRGSDLALLRSDSGAEHGVEQFRRAIALDSGYADAWAGLARLEWRVWADRAGPERRVRLAEAERAVQRAIALDDSLAEAHAVLGLLRSLSYDLDGAGAALHRAVALDPDRATLHEYLSNYYLVVQRPADALREAERALALAPLSPTATAEVARALAANNRCDEALARLAPLAALDPPMLRVAPIAAQCHARAGRWTEAITVLTPQATRNDRYALALLGYMHGRAGHRREARAIQDTLLARWRRGLITSFYLSYVPASLGDHDTAFAWLDSAVADGSLGFFPGLRPGIGGPPLDMLADDPRLASVLRRLAPKS